MRKGFGSMKLSIQTKFLMVIFLILMIGTIAGSIVIVMNERSVLNSFLLGKARSLCAYTSNISKDPILYKDRIQLDTIVEDINKDDDMVFAVIRDAAGIILTTSSSSFNSNIPGVTGAISGVPKGSEMDQILSAVKKKTAPLELTLPVMVDNNEIGSVTLGLTTAGIHRQLIKTVFFIFLVNCGVAILLSIALLVASNIMILHPISKVIEVSGKVAEGDLSRTIAINTRDELGDLASSLNGMIGNLNHMLQRISRASRELVTVSDKLSEASKNVISAVQVQSEGVSEASSAVVEIGSSTGKVGQSVEKLSFSATESSSSILEMTASIGDVSNNMEFLSKAVEDVSSSIVQMTASIRQIGSSIDNLMQAAAAAATSIMEMDSSINEVERNAQETALISEKVRQDAETGKVSVEATAAGISNIKHFANVTYDVINNLSSKAVDIGAILSVIDEVAKQTNLLALNAAIIAAQAGEHGKGFGVVADEIKTLADRTTHSTREIAMVIHGVQDETQRAVEAIKQAEESIAEGEHLSKKSGDALNQIVSGVKKVSEQMGKIARATGEQAKGSRLIRDASEQVTGMVEQIGCATREQTQGSEVIKDSAERMRDMALQVRYALQEQTRAGSLVVQSNEEIMSMIRHIRHACTEQGSASEQIVEAVGDIEKTTAINLEATGIMNGAVDSLSEQIRLLRQEMESFKV